MTKQANSEVLLGIGLPVYNGERFITQTIESILNQTMTNFILVISDNASTDRTEEICKAYVDVDKRIKYVRNSTNVGINQNVANVFKESQHNNTCALPLSGMMTSGLQILAKD